MEHLVTVFVAALCAAGVLCSALPEVEDAHVGKRAASLPRPLSISAFNIKVFGRSKMSDPVTAAQIRDIVRRYDVILIQEIRDITGEALQQLWDMVGSSQFGMVVSGRLGRTTSKEEYAYFFRLSAVQMVGVHQYDDGPDDYTDAFEREPFSVRITPVGDVIILGDLNADCSYAKESDLLHMPIYNQNLFHWPIGFDADTTVSSTHCAYDRFILSGPNVRSALIPGSVGVFLFDKYFGMTYTEAYDLSDHYPIELELL